MNPSRRIFLRQIVSLAVAGATVALAEPALAKQIGARSLALEHASTGKQLKVVYAVGNRYVPEALASLNAFLGDHSAGKVGRMDPKLFDLLYRLKLNLGNEQPFQIISGYRCPATNKKMRKTGHRGVAKNSLHMQGRAIDLRLEGIRLSELRDAAIVERVGGVGFYPRDHFVHVDTGQVRNW